MEMMQETPGLAGRKEEAGGAYGGLGVARPWYATELY